MTQIKSAFELNGDSGYVIALDAKGRQVVEMCGPKSEVRKKIEAAGVTIERAPPQSR